MTALNTNPPLRHPNRLAHFWRCSCGIGLLVRFEGRHVSFQRGGRRWKRCPHCRRQLIAAWRETA